MDGSFIGQNGAAGIGASGKEFIGPDLIYGLASTFSVPECRRCRSVGVCRVRRVENRTGKYHPDRHRIQTEKRKKNPANPGAEAVEDFLPFYRFLYLSRKIPRYFPAFR